MGRPLAVANISRRFVCLQAGLAKQEELLAAHVKARARKTSPEAQMAAEWQTRRERIVKGRSAAGAK